MPPTDATFWCDIRRAHVVDSIVAYRGQRVGSCLIHAGSCRSCSILGMSRIWACGFDVEQTLVPLWVNQSRPTPGFYEALPSVLLWYWAQIGHKCRMAADNCRVNCPMKSLPVIEMDITGHLKPSKVTEERRSFGSCSILVGCARER